MSEDNKDHKDKPEPEIHDLDPKKDPKGGGGFKPASPGTGGTTTQPSPGSGG